MLRLFTVFGVPVRLHYTWFLALALMVPAMAITLYGMDALWKNGLLGLAGALLFFISLTLHGFAQGVVAHVRGTHVRSIVLYPFGGILQIPEETDRPVAELMIAGAGPVSLAILFGLYCGISSALAAVELFAASEMVQLAASFTILVALLNLIPGFPLDGGMLLKAFLWLKTGDRGRATRIAARAGRAAGLVMVLAGVLTAIFAQQWFTGAALAFMGWFLERAAASSLRQALVREALRGVTARHMMTEEYTPIKQQLSVALVRDYIANSGQRCFLVVEEGELQGIITLNDIIKTPPKHRDSARIEDIMTPRKELKTTHPGEPAADLLEQMELYNIDQMPVLENGRIIGMVLREKLVRFLAIRDLLKS